MHGTGVIGWLAASLLLASCTLPTHHAARLTTPPPTLTPVTTPPVPPSPSPTPTPVLRPEPVSYVGLVSLLHGPTVPVVVQRKKYVLLPGGRQLRLEIAAAGGPCDTTLAASGSGRWLAYTTATGDLHVIDTRVRNEYSLGAGCDPVWGPDDRLAYLVSGPPNAWGGYASVIVVRPAPLSAGRVWAKGRLRPQGWAGNRLVYTSADRVGRTTPVITSRPGGGHPVPSRQAHGRFVGARADGRRMLLQLDTLDHEGRPLASIALVDTATLRVLSTVSPKGFEGLTSAVWTGDRIVASNGIEDGDSAHPPPGLIRLGVYRDRLSIQQVAVPSRPTQTVNEYISDFHDNGNGTLTATHHWDGGGVLLRCRISTLTCTDVLSLGGR